MTTEFPHVTVNSEIKGIKYSDKVSTPLVLQTYSAEIEVISTNQVYHQSTTLTFKNYSNKKLEGEFIFPLPESSTICGFAIEIDEQMIDASIVESTKAEKTFDAEVREKKPTALVESVVGNQYRTKIYPWDPNTTKKVRIDFIADLDRNSEGLFMSIPLEVSKQEMLSSVDLSILLKNEKIEPFLFSKQNYNFTKQKKKYVLNLSRNDLMKLQNLKIQIPSTIQESIIVEENEIQDQYYFDIKQNIKSNTSKKSKSQESVISVLWDVSFSREKQRETFQKLEFNLLKQLQKIYKIDLYLFSNDIEFKGSFNNFDDIIKVISGAYYDGGTNLIQLSKLDLSKYLYSLLFTDGIDTLSPENTSFIASFKGVPPIYSFNSSPNYNSATLRNISDVSGGRYFSIDSNSNLQDITSTIGYSPFSFLFAEYDENDMTEVYPSKKCVVENETFHMNGILLAKESQIILNFGIGNEILEKRTIKLAKKDAKKSKIVGIQWAKQCLNELNDFSAQHKDQILSIGRQFSIVTSDTTLMVLETLEQHLKHKIIPAKSRTFLYEAYQDHIAEEEKNQLKKVEEKLKKVEYLWEQYLKWYRRDYSSEIVEKMIDEIEQMKVSTKLTSQRVEEIPTKLVEIQKSAESKIEKKKAIVEMNIEKEKKRIQMEYEKLKELCENERIKIEKNQNVRKEFKLQNKKKKTYKEKYSNKIKPDDSFKNVFDTFLSKMEDNMEFDSSSSSSDDENSTNDRKEKSKNDKKSKKKKKMKNQETNIPVSLNLAPVGSISGKGLGVGGSLRGGGRGGRGGGRSGGRGGGTRTRQTARRSTGGKAPMVIQESNESSVSVKKWNPDVEYLKILKDSNKEDIYKNYFLLREEEKYSPAFYLDVCDYLFKQDFKKESLKVLSNLTELEFDNAQLLRIIAYKLEEIGEYDLSIQMFRKVLSLKPEEPQSYRDLALVLEKNGKYKDALQLFYKVIIGNWDSRFEEIEITVLQEMNRLIHFHGDFNLNIPKSLIQYSPLELRIVMAWDTDMVDIDLHTIEPSGEQVFYGNKNSRNGGLNSVDFTRGYGPETYQIKVASPGIYKIRAKYYSNHQQSVTGGTTVLLSLFTNYSVPEKEKYQQITIRLNGHKDIYDVAEIEINNEEISNIQKDLQIEKEKNYQILELYKIESGKLNEIEIQRNTKLTEIDEYFNEEIQNFIESIAKEIESSFGAIRKKSESNSLEQAIFEFEYL
eukprot:gene2258-2432_t